MNAHRFQQAYSESAADTMDADGPFLCVRQDDDNNNDGLTTHSLCLNISLYYPEGERINNEPASEQKIENAVVGRL